MESAGYQEIVREGEKKGIGKGIQQGIQQGMQKGIQEGRLDELRKGEWRDAIVPS